MDHIAQDIRHALRRLVRDKGTTAIALVTLGLGIGANTAIYSLISSVLLKPLPYNRPEGLAMIWNPAEERSTTWLSAREVMSYRQEATSFSAIGAWTATNASLTGGSDAERVRTALATASLFEALGVPAVLGRTITGADDGPGANDAVVLGYGLWRRRFGGDSSLIGRTIQVNGRARTVIGVMPSDFRLPLDFRDAGPTELFVPLGLDPANPGGWGNRQFVAVGRLHDGIAPERASAELERIEESWYAAGYIVRQPEAPLNRHAVPLSGFVTGEIRTTLLVLLGAVGFVLLIACANVANLLLARADARRREMALRTALGASPGRVIRLLLTESGLLAIGGGGLGLGVAWAAVRALVALRPAGLPRIEELSIDPLVLVITALVSLSTGVLFGLVPALRLARPDLTGMLKDGGRGGTAGVERQRFRRGLVVMELAFSVILLIGAGLMIRTFVALTRIDPGFDPRRVLTMRVAVPPAEIPTAEGVAAFFRQAVDRVEALPGVRSAAAVRVLPLSRTIGDWSIMIEGRPYRPEENPNGDWQIVTPGYFETMGIGLVRGRVLVEADDAGAEPVAVINQTMAEKYWPGEDAVGRRFRLGSEDQPWVTIVGITRTVRHNSVTEAPRQEMYLAHAQWNRATGGTVRDMTITAKTAGDPIGLAGPARQALRDLNPNLPVADLRSMEDVVGNALAQPRFGMLLLGLFALLALTLALIGIYGTVSLLVTERSQEIGIRMALGAGRGEVLTMVLRQGLMLAVGGLAVGMGGALFLTRLMTGLIYGVSTLDVVTFALVPALLAGVTLLACLVPARRAASTDPVTVLRGE